MQLSENIRLAIEGLKANKVRALLTMLGIIIGIASVIGILTVGDSVSSTVSDQMGSLGSSNITIMLQQKDSTSSASPMGNSSSSAQLGEDDTITEEMIAATYARYADEITGISYSKTVGTGEAKKGQDYANVTTLGVSADYLSVNSVTLLSGRTLTESDMDNARNIAIVSDALVDNLYGGDEKAALGEQLGIYMDNEVQFFTIIGVYEYETSSTGTSISSAQDVRTNVYIPVSTATKLLGSDDGYSSLTITAQSDDIVTFAATLEDYLNRYYKDNDDYGIYAMTMESMLDTLNTMLDTISLALSVIAGISLLVGGIGVMNIMLVSVTERTKEIGIRKALGATSNQIRVQFVVESIIVCVIGGIIGITLGALAGYFGSSLIGTAALPSASNIALSVGFALAIGIFFGYYPANKAAQLNPIDALRYE